MIDAHIWYLQKRQTSRILCPQIPWESRCAKYHMLHATGAKWRSSGNAIGFMAHGLILTHPLEPPNHLTPSSASFSTWSQHVKLKHCMGPIMFHCCPCKPSNVSHDWIAPCCRLPFHMIFCGWDGCINCLAVSHLWWSVYLEGMLPMSDSLSHLVALLQ